MPSMPWISIPKFAEPGQPHAFANREAQLLSLYNALVRAGNAVREGRMDVRHKHVVTGYMGVGKSALILQALGMIRDDQEARDARKKMIGMGNLMEPIDQQRWIILRVSGKHVSNVDAIGYAIQRALAEEPESQQPPRSEPLLPLLADIHQQADQVATHALELPIFGQLFWKREFDDYKKVRSSLQAVAYALEYVQRWHGALQTEKLEQSATSQSSADVEAQIISQLKAIVGKTPLLSDSEMALKLAASIIRKTGASSIASTQVDRQWRISAQFVVEALNIFFEQATRARLPTLLVLDDLDEVTSAIGPSFEDRSRALSWILGPFTQLKPTCLVLGLRQEYMHEDIHRQFYSTHVPPMTRDTAATAIERWGEYQLPPLSGEQVGWLQSIGARILQNFERTAPVVIPLHFLQLVAALANSPAVAEEDNVRLLQRYLGQMHQAADVRVFERLADVMPDDDVMRCAASSPVESGAYALTESERKALEQAGLIRPAMAGDPHDTRMVIDPLCAYLRMARKPLAPPTAP